MYATCLEECSKFAKKKKDKLGYYSVTVDLANGKQQNLPINAAMVTKSLWEWTGGFPISCTVGAPDALFISILLGHGGKHLHRVKEFTPLYWVREHPDQDSNINSKVFHKEVLSIRNIETERWKPPAWSNYD